MYYIPIFTIYIDINHIQFHTYDMIVSCSVWHIFHYDMWFIFFSDA